MFEKTKLFGERVYRVQPRNDMDLQSLAEEAENLEDIIEDEYEDEEEEKVETKEPTYTPESFQMPKVDIPNRIEPIKEPEVIPQTNNTVTNDIVDYIGNLDLSFRRGSAILRIVEGDIKGAIRLLEKDTK